MTSYATVRYHHQMTRRGCSCGHNVSGGSWYETADHVSHVLNYMFGVPLQDAVGRSEEFLDRPNWLQLFDDATWRWSCAQCPAHGTAVSQAERARIVVEHLFASHDYRWSKHIIETDENGAEMIVRIEDKLAKIELNAS